MTLGRGLSTLAALALAGIAEAAAVPYRTGPAVAGSHLPETLAGQELRPLSLASADFDGDGIPDLAVGFGSPEGGFVVLYRGNVDALYPNSPEARLRRDQARSVAEPFLPTDRVLTLSAPPDFLFAGDFDADGLPDLVAAPLGGSAVSILRGDPPGFREERRIALPGALTALAVGEMGRRDGLADLVLAVEAPRAAAALIYQAPAGALSAAPESVPLPSPASSLRIGPDRPGGPGVVRLEGRDGAGRIIRRGDAAWSLVEETSVRADGPGGSAPHAEAAEPEAPAALRMRVNGHGVPGWVVLGPDAGLSILEPTAGATLTVNTALNGNTRDAVLTLNEAIRVAVGTLAVAALTPEEQAQVSGAPANPGLDAIRFDVPGGVTPIIVGTLPEITDPVTIDGTTQDGGWVEMDGTAASGLWISAGGSTVRGMVLYGWSHGIYLEGPGGNVIEGNVLGLDATGAALQTNNTGIDVLSPDNVIGGTAPAARNVIANSTSYGIYVGDPSATGTRIEGNYIGTTLDGDADPSASAGRGIRVIEGDGATIGGSAPGAGNVISGNGSQGVRLDADGNLVQGNRIGVSADGAAAVANGSYGIWVLGFDNTIGGPAPGAGNVVSGNEEHGILVDVSADVSCVVQGNLVGVNAEGTAAIPNVGHGISVVGASGTHVSGNLISGNYLSGISLINSLGTVPTGTVIQGNFIGTDVTGTRAVANLQNGVTLGSALGTVLGGVAPEAANLISGNLGHGIQVSGSASADPNLIRGNLVGTDVFGTSALGNGLSGMRFENNTSGHLAGGVAPGEANTFAFNGGAGASSSAGRELNLFPNRFFGNGGLGIDLFGDGPTPNSAGRSNNFPVLNEATTSAGGTTVAGTLEALAGTTFDVYLFSSVSCDPSGFGEGRDFLGATTATTAGDGQASFSTVVQPPVPGGRYVTAFAKAPGALDHDTSELSFCHQVSGSAPPGSATLEVSVIAPGRGGDAGPVTVRVTGQGFLPGAMLRLERTGEADVAATGGAVAADGLSLTAVLPLGGAAQGAWDVVVENPGGGSASLPAGFRVEAGTLPDLWADLLGRGSLVVRNGREQTFFVVFGNRGNTDSYPAKFRVTIPWQLRVTHVDDLDGSRPVVSVDKPTVPGGTGDTAIQFFVRSIPANSSRTLAFRLLTVAAEPGEFGQRLELKVWHMTAPGLDYVFPAVDPSVTLTPEVLDDSPGHLSAVVHVSGGLAPGDVSFEMTSVEVPFESDPQITKIVEGDQVTYRYRVAFSSSPSTAFDVAVSASRETMDAVGSAVQSAASRAEARMLLNEIEAMSPAEQAQVLRDMAEASAAVRDVGGAVSDVGAMEGPAPGPVVDVLSDAVETRLCDAVRKASGAAQAACDGLRKDLDRSFGSCPAADGNRPSATLVCPFPAVRSGGRYVEVYQAIDPNEKTGPGGSQGPEHFVDGETPMAYTITFENLETATGAAQEVVVTDTLDASKLDVSTLELGPIAFGERTLAVPAGSTSFTGDVDLRPEVNLIARVTAGLDPQSGLLQWRFFSLDPATGLPTEDPVLGFLPPNVSSPEGEGHVTFTVRAATGLATGTEIFNRASIVFDANPALLTQDWKNTIDATPPASQVAAIAGPACSAIPVAWSGTDGHSGIANYDVLVSVNGSAFTPWKSATTATSGTFPGTVGDTYAFYSVARDRAGNAEASPGSPDTAVTVGAPSPRPESLAPTSGPAAGAAVSISGTGFEAGAAVTVGGAAASGVVVADAASVTATFPALAAGALYDVAVANPGGCAGTLEDGWLADFGDVPDAHLFHDFVEKIFRRAVTAGCGGGSYCPDSPVTRAQMAVFLVKGKRLGTLTPAPAAGIFADVPPGAFAADWIEQLAGEGVTGGCGSGNYCPASPVTRAQMAVFLLKSKYGALHTPPPAAGVFTDVPPGSFAAAWIEQLAAEGITGGCGGGNYCPGAPVTRGQMAVFLSKTFGF